MGRVLVSVRSFGLDCGLEVSGGVGGCPAAYLVYFACRCFESLSRLHFAVVLICCRLVWLCLPVFGLRPGLPALFASLCRVASLGGCVGKCSPATRS